MVESAGSRWLTIEENSFVKFKAFRPVGYANQTMPSTASCGFATAIIRQFVRSCLRILFLCCISCFNSSLQPLSLSIWQIVFAKTTRSNAFSSRIMHCFCRSPTGAGGTRRFTVARGYTSDPLSYFGVYGNDSLRIRINRIPKVHLMKPVKQDGRNPRKL